MLFDSNIIIDFLHGHLEAYAAVAVRPRYVSIVTWVEVLAGTRSPLEDSLARRVLRHFNLIEIDRAIAEQAVAIRRERGLKLPDGFLLATARTRGVLLVTRDRDFDPTDPAILVPYTL